MNRSEWLKWRKGGLGSSDAPIIMGVSPWKTRLQLFEEKISDEIVEHSNYITDLGNEMEPRIRSLFEMHSDDSFEPELCSLEQFPFLLASLDGRSKKDRKCFIEIKLSGKEDWQASKNEDKVPDKYFPQIQHQFMVSGCVFGFYLSYLFEKGMNQNVLTMDKLAIVIMKPDPAYLQKLFQEECKFWDLVRARKAPEATDKDFQPLVGLKKEVDEWRRLNLQIKELELLRDSYREEILKKAEEEGARRYLCAGLKIVKQERQGNVQYKEIPELAGVDLEKYRGKSTSFWSIK